MPGVNGSIDLYYQIADAPASPGLGLRQFSTLVISAQDRSTDITIGDLSPAGVSEVIVNIPTTGDGGRNITLDTKADGGASQIAVAPFLNTYIDHDGPRAPRARPKKRAASRQHHDRHDHVPARHERRRS